MNLGDKIRKARTDKGITQEALAREVGITVSTIYKIEKNKMNPTFSVTSKIAKALEISLDDLT